MATFKKILLPVDGSESSKLAMQKALGIVEAMKSELVLLYVTGVIPGFITGQPKDEALQSQLEEADQILAPYREFLTEHRVNFNEVIKPGFNAGEKICVAAGEQKCDLIVMGSRGLGDWAGMMLGSVTHRVLSHCDIPVLVTR
ncbi:MAG: universal stress protein [Desulfobulbaceae bacterium]|nr:universal stress protein [Desulfobulbaceae bacterium]